MYELYVLENCPYSIKVMNYLEKNNIKYVKKLISEKDTLEELIVLGGKEQVPFLYDKARTVQMYESDEIVKYIEKMSR